MKQQVSPVLGVVIAVLVVAVIGFAYMALKKTGPPPPIPMAASSGPMQSMSLPGMDGTRAPNAGAAVGSSGTPSAAMSLPGAGGGRSTPGGMPGAPMAPP